MADAGLDKKLKLANTRKRFKELQALKTKRNGNNEQSNQAGNENDSSNSVQSSNRTTPVEPQIVLPLALALEEVLLSSDSNITDAPPEHTNNANPHLTLGGSRLVPASDQRTVMYNNDEQEANLPNYFEQPDKQDPGEFFDNISPTSDPGRVHNDNSPSLLTYFNANTNNEQSGPQNIGLPRYFDNINSSEAIWENTVPETQTVASKENYKLFPEGEGKIKEPMSKPNQTEDVLCQDHPEIKENVRKSAENLTLEPLFPVSQLKENNLQDLFSPINNQNLMDYLGTTGATEEEKSDICHTNKEIDSSTNLTKREIQQSNNVESLKQLSDQLAQMIEPSYEYSLSGSITDLEKRNIELAAALAKQKLTSEQLRAVNAELQLKITQLDTESTKQELEFNLQNAQEVVRLKNELQTHLQTIGLLVAEKTELSSNLSQYEISSKQKTAECEELQARLRASRSRVADLERELNGLKLERSKADNVEERYSAALEELRQEYRALREQKDELAQDLLEVREKLKNTLEEGVKFQQDNKDLNSKLSLAEIKIQQLSSGGALDVDSQVEQLTQAKFSLEGEITNLNQMLKSIVKERDESTVQYQQYAQQLNAQISNLSSKLGQLQQEKENLVMQEQNRIKHLGELERQLQNLQNDQVTYATRNSNSTDLRNELEKSRELCVQLQIDKTTVEENYTKVSNEKDLLMKELHAKADSIIQLESMVEQLRGNQPDSVKLLATMESDKVAASRAIQQNKELKQQLESMQEVVMKMDNDKVVLTENLKGQQQTNKELMEKLQKTELTLQSLADAIEIKDKELTHLREAAEDIDRQAIQHEQLEDHLRHYEAHDNSAHIVQRELQEARQTIAKLTNRHSEELADARRTILSLTNEINKLKRSAISAISIEVAEEVKQAQTDDDDTVRNENVLNKENAMKYLEEKVKRTMQEIADLTDEKQRLEHIVLQLQGETETIGEYVALYQHQRMVLKQKAVEKDQQLTQLASDREQIKVKLDKLNELIRRLVTEKGAVPAELLQHQDSMNAQANNFCEEHSRMNDEINRIKQSNIIVPHQNDVTTSHTAEEIISLLSEIKTSNLVTPDANFHHCPWCSGQLMTV